MVLAAELTQAELEPLFEVLAAQWHDEADGLSLTYRKVTHPAYLKIIGLGPRVVPLIVEDLRERGGWWFAALEALTRENPASSLDSGHPEAVKAAWLQWADARRNE